jgi:hypothetical protein
MIKRTIMLVVAALFAMSIMAPVAFAAQDLPDNCKKERGTITCTTTDKPGNSEQGSGDPPPTAVVEDQTKGNTTNKSPEESQDLADNECTQGSPGLCKQAERQ